MIKSQLVFFCVIFLAVIVIDFLMLLLDALPVDLLNLLIPEILLVQLKINMTFEKSRIKNYILSFRSPKRLDKLVQQLWSIWTSKVSS